jgi:chorismate mutase
MKTTILILALLFSVSSFAQFPMGNYSISNGVEMTATQTTTTTDQKFQMVDRSFTEVKKQIRQMQIQEAIQNTVSSKIDINKLLNDLQTVLDLSRSKFIKTTTATVTVDSLRTVTERVNLTKEIARLKEETLLAGSDSTQIRPTIDMLKVRRAELIKIINTWVKVK